MNSRSGIKFRSGYLKGTRASFVIAFFIKGYWQNERFQRLKTPGPFTNYKLRLPSSAWHCQATSHIVPKAPIYVMAMIEISKACAGVAVEGCYGLTEAGACSDAAALSCKAELKGDKHIVNGTKVFISNGPVVRYCVLVASTNLYKGVINLIVDWKETPGYKMGKI